MPLLCKKFAVLHSGKKLHMGMHEFNISKSICRFCKYCECYLIFMHIHILANNVQKKNLHACIMYTLQKKTLYRIPLPICSVS